MQAKATGDELVVGLIPDSEILRCKGPPVLSEAERYSLVDAVKWVDEVITGVHILTVGMASMCGPALRVGRRSREHEVMEQYNERPRSRSMLPPFQCPSIWLLAPAALAYKNSREHSQPGTPFTALALPVLRRTGTCHLAKLHWPYILPGQTVFRHLAWRFAA